MQWLECCRLSSSYNSTAEANVEKQKSSHALILLTGIFTASLIAANMLGSRLVQVFGITVSIGYFVFPFTFITADVISELFGKKTANQVVRVGIVLQIYVLLFVALGFLLPSSPLRDTESSYKVMFGLTPRMVLASIVAYSFSQFLDVKIFSELRNRTGSRYLVLRANIAAWSSQFVDTVIFTLIFLGGVIPLHELGKSFLLGYTTKVILATIDSPLVKVGVRLLKNKGDEHA